MSDLQSLLTIGQPTAVRVISLESGLYGSNEVSAELAADSDTLLALVVVIWLAVGLWMLVRRHQAATGAGMDKPASLSTPEH